MEAILSKMSINCRARSRSRADRDLEIGLEDNMRTDRPRDNAFKFFADVMMPAPVTPDNTIRIRVDPSFAPRKSQQQVWAHANARRSNEQLFDDGDDIVSDRVNIHAQGLPVKRRLF